MKVSPAVSHRFDIYCFPQIWHPLFPFPTSRVLKPQDILALFQDRAGSWKCPPNKYNLLPKKSKVLPTFPTSSLWLYSHSLHGLKSQISRQWNHRSESYFSSLGKPNFPLDCSHFWHLKTSFCSHLVHGLTAPDIKAICQGSSSEIQEQDHEHAHPINFT